MKYVSQLRPVPTGIVIVHGEKLLPDGTLTERFKDLLHYANTLIQNEDHSIIHLVLAGGQMRPKLKVASADAAEAYFSKNLGGTKTLQKKLERLQTEGRIKPKEGKKDFGALIFERQSKSLEEQVKNIAKLDLPLPEPGIYKEHFRKIYAVVSAKRIRALQYLFEKHCPKLCNLIEWRYVGELPLIATPRLVLWFRYTFLPYLRKSGKD